VKLNYGNSLNRFSWIIYKLENLKCYGKADGIVYPSEKNEDRIQTIENDIEENTREIEQVKERTVENQNDIETNQIEIVEIKEQTVENQNDIFALQSRTSNLETKVNQDDFYFKYSANS